MINGLQEYETIVLKPTSWYSNEKDYDYNGIKVYRYRSYELPSGIFPGLFDFLSVWSLKRKLGSIGVSLQHVKVVHAHVNSLGIYANALKRVNNKIKSIVQHHGFDVLSIENGRLGRYKWHQKWVQNYGVKICNSIDLHVAVSNKTLSYLKTYTGVRIKSSYVLYNGVDTEKFYPLQKEGQMNCFIIGCVGNFWKLKDQITLIKAAQELIVNKGVKLQIKFVGSGATFEECNKYVIENNLTNNFEFIKELPHDQLIYFYNSLNLFVLPSYYEAFGCVYTEAYACGVPFIGVKGQGIEEIIAPDERNLWLINKGNVNELVQLIQNQIKNPKEQKLCTPISLQQTVADFMNYLKAHNDAI